MKTLAPPLGGEWGVSPPITRTAPPSVGRGKGVSSCIAVDEARSPRIKPRPVSMVAYGSIEDKVPRGYKPCNMVVWDSHKRGYPLKPSQENHPARRLGREKGGREMLNAHQVVAKETKNSPTEGSR